MPNYKNVVRRTHVVRRAYAGMTLLELIVVLVILGLASALALPTLLSPKSQSTEMNDLVARARGLAISRSQALELTVSAGGAWQIREASRTDSIAAGQAKLQLAATATLLFSPFGTCMAPLQLPPGLQLQSSPCRVFEAKRS